MTCFNCHAVATTDDHVPPKVFFPEQKDLTHGQDLRKDLIKVPSCAPCNHRASLDDEYVAYMIATSHINNPTALNHVAGKIVRALKRSEGLRTRLLSDMQPVLLDGHRTVAIRADFEAFNRVMVRTARGLHFRRTGHRLTDDLVATSPLIIGSNYPFEGWAQIQSVIDELPWQDGPGCQNLEVFRYRYLTEKPVFDLQFYGGFHVLVTPVVQDRAV